VRDEAVVVDRERRLPGRGAYVHPRAACLDAALAHDALQRTFRRPVTVPDDFVDLFE
jgi:uncharacterized protein